MKQNHAFDIYGYMLEFKQDDTAVPLILTLTENVSLADPFYLFAFTHVITKDVVAFIKADADDESNYPQRYNQYTIDPSVLFDGFHPGEWHYKIYEQDNDTNLDPALSRSVLEYGKMILNRAQEFAYELYDSPTTFKTYNG